MNAKKNLTALAVTALLTVPAFSATNGTHIHIPKFSDSLITTAHASSFQRVSLPSSYVGKWTGKSNYGANATVTLGRNSGQFNSPNNNHSDIVYTNNPYEKENHYPYCWWDNGMIDKEGVSNSLGFKDGHLHMSFDTADFTLSKVHKHHHHTPTPKPTPSPEPTPSPSPSPAPSNNNNNGGGAVTPTGSSTSSNNTYFGNNGYNANASLDSSNLSLGSVNGINNTSNTANINNKLPQTNESTHTTAEAILGATALTASASLMALDFSKKHKYEAMEDTDAKHSSNSNDRSYNTIMRGTFADLSKSLKHL